MMVNVFNKVRILGFFSFFSVNEFIGFKLQIFCDKDPTKQKGKTMAHEKKLLGGSLVLFSDD